MLYAYIDFLKRYDVQWYMVGYVKLSNKEIVVSLVRGLVNLSYNIRLGEIMMTEQGIINQLTNDESVKEDIVREFLKAYPNIKNASYAEIKAKFKEWYREKKKHLGVKVYPTIPDIPAKPEKPDLIFSEYLGK